MARRGPHIVQMSELANFKPSPTILASDSESQKRLLLRIEFVESLMLRTEDNKPIFYPVTWIEVEVKGEVLHNGKFACNSLNKAIEVYNEN